MYKHVIHIIIYVKLSRPLKHNERFRRSMYIHSDGYNESLMDLFETTVNMNSRNRINYNNIECNKVSLMPTIEGNDNR